MLSYVSTSRPRPRLFMLAGIPGCGKSTWAKTFFRPGQIVSSDAIREEKWPGEPYRKERNDAVFGEFYRRVGDLLEEGNDVVADATFLVYWARWKAMDVAHYYDAEIHLIFFNNTMQGVSRNAQRLGHRHVPRDNMDLMISNHHESRSAILDENYTSITIIERTQ